MTKIGVRKLWFQIHKWIGLILAVLVIPISLTGAALVWHEPIEEAMHPERFAVSGPATLAPAAYADAARNALGKGERLSRIEIPDAGPVTATANKAGTGRPQRVTFYLDGANGRLLGTERSGEGLFPLLHSLHGSLMIPGAGRSVVGWVGVAMLISSLTGLWLWWPLSGSLKRGFRWKRHRNTDTNLHYLVGFWVSLPLFVLSLTGVWISFPPVFAGLDGPRAGTPDRGAMARAKPLDAPVTSLAVATANANAVAPGRIVAITWPTERKREWAIDIARGQGAPATITVKDADGTAKPSPARAQPSTWARTMRVVHDGTGMPLLWQLILFLGGIIPAILAVTGIIMWWRARGWRGELAGRAGGGIGQPSSA